MWHGPPARDRTGENRALFSKWYFGPNLPTWALFAELFVAGLIVVLSGTRLTRLADTISDRLNLGGALVGLLLLATVTSLPEVVTGATATYIGNVDLAFAGILGSCSFNIILIVFLNWLIGGGSILRQGEATHTLTSAFGIILIAITLAGIVLIDATAATDLTLAQLMEGLWAILIVATYLVTVSLVCRYEADKRTLSEEQTERQKVEVGTWVQVTVVSLMIVASGWWLASSGDVLADHEIGILGRPLGATIVGVLFLAAATSLPEIATSVAAVRLGNLNLALGNIFGSNMFNIFVVPMLKVTSLARGDELLMHGADFHLHKNLVAGLLPILLTAIAAGGLIYHSRRRVLRRFGFDSVLLAVVYLFGMIMLMSMKTS